MILNATILRIDTHRTDAGGDIAYTQGAALSIRCAVDKVTSSQRFTQEAIVKDANQQLLVLKQALADAGVAAPAALDRVVFAYDNDDPQTGLVTGSDQRVHGVQSHFELFLKAVS